MSDKEFLTWIYERLIKVHGESSCVDYMCKLRSIIGAMPVDQVTPNRVIDTSIKSENVISTGYSFSGDIAVKRDSDEYALLNDLFLSQKSVIGLFINFGYAGSVIICDKTLFDAGGEECATFSAREA